VEKSPEWSGTFGEELTTDRAASQVSTGGLFEGDINPERRLTKGLLELEIGVELEIGTAQFAV